jgi:hypothetical protein
MSTVSGPVVLFPPLTHPTAGASNLDAATGLFTGASAGRNFFSHRRSASATLSGRGSRAGSETRQIEAEQDAAALRAQVALERQRVVDAERKQRLAERAQLRADDAAVEAARVRTNAAASVESAAKEIALLKAEVEATCRQRDENARARREAERDRVQAIASADAARKLMERLTTDLDLMRREHSERCPLLLAEAQSRADALAAQLGDVRRTDSTHRGDAESLRVELSEMRATAQTLGATAHAATRELEAAHAQRRDVQALLDETQRHAVETQAQLEAQLARERERVTAVTAEADAARGEVQQLMQRLRAAEGQHELALAQVATARSEIDALARQVMSARTAAEEHALRSDDLTTRTRTLEEEIARRNAAARQDADVAMQEAARLHAELDAARRDLAKLRTDLSAQQREGAAAEERVRILTQDVERREATLQRQQTLHDAERHRENEADIVALRRELSAAQSMADTLREQLRRHQTELVESASRHDEVTVAAEALRRKHDSASAADQEALATARHRNSELERALRDERAAASATRVALDAASTDTATLRQRLHHLEAELQRRDAALAQSESLAARAAQDRNGAMADTQARTAQALHEASVANAQRLEAERRADAASLKLVELQSELAEARRTAAATAAAAASVDGAVAALAATEADRDADVRDAAALWLLCRRTDSLVSYSRLQTDPEVVLALPGSALEPPKSVASPTSLAGPPGTAMQRVHPGGGVVVSPLDSLRDGSAVCVSASRAVTAPLCNAVATLNREHLGRVAALEKLSLYAAFLARLGAMAADCRAQQQRLHAIHVAAGGLNAPINATAASMHHTRMGVDTSLSDISVSQLQHRASAGNAGTATLVGTGPNAAADQSHLLNASTSSGRRLWRSGEADPAFIAALRREERARAEHLQTALEAALTDAAAAQSELAALRQQLERAFAERDAFLFQRRALTAMCREADNGIFALTLVAVERDKAMALARRAEELSFDAAGSKQHKGEQGVVTYAQDAASNVRRWWAARTTAKRRWRVAVLAVIASIRLVWGVAASGPAAFRRLAVQPHALDARVPRSTIAASYLAEQVLHGVEETSGDSSQLDDRTKPRKVDLSTFQRLVYFAKDAAVASRIRVASSEDVHTATSSALKQEAAGAVRRFLSGRTGAAPLSGSYGADEDRGADDQSAAVTPASASLARGANLPPLPMQRGRPTSPHDGSATFTSSAQSAALVHRATSPRAPVVAGGTTPSGTVESDVDDDASDASTSAPPSRPPGRHGVTDAATSPGRVGGGRLGPADTGRFYTHLYEHDVASTGIVGDNETEAPYSPTGTAGSGNGGGGGAADRARSVSGGGINANLPPHFIHPSAERRYPSPDNGGAHPHRAAYHTTQTTTRVFNQQQYTGTLNGPPSSIGAMVNSSTATVGMTNMVDHSVAATIGEEDSEALRLLLEEIKVIDSQVTRALEVSPGRYAIDAAELEARNLSLARRRASADASMATVSSASALRNRTNVASPHAGPFVDASFGLSTTANQSQSFTASAASPLPRVVTGDSTAVLLPAASANATAESQNPAAWSYQPRFTSPPRPTTGRADIAKEQVRPSTVVASSAPGSVQSFLPAATTAFRSSSATRDRGSQSRQRHRRSVSAPSPSHLATTPATGVMYRSMVAMSSPAVAAEGPLPVVRRAPSPAFLQENATPTSALNASTGSIGRGVAFGAATGGALGVGGYRFMSPGAMKRMAAADSAARQSLSGGVSSPVPLDPKLLLVTESLSQTSGLRSRATVNVA